MSANLFPLGDGYRLGVKLHRTLQREMLDGKPISCPEDMGLLAQAVAYSRGDHLEIGTAYGASMLVAVEAIEQRRHPGKVVCIEPFGEQRRNTLYKAVEREFLRNVEYFGVAEKIEHIKAFSHPLPIKNLRRFGSAFIDGDHSFEYVLHDWQNLCGIVNYYIVFHDYSKQDVYRVVLEHAAKDDRWELAAVLGWSAVMKRKKD